MKIKQTVIAAIAAMMIAGTAIAQFAPGPGGGGSGTVTSVGISLPSIFSVTGSPITTSGTLTGTLASQPANTVLSSPNGSSGAPTFRALTAPDIPSLDAAKITSGTLPVNRGGTGVTTSTGTGNNVLSDSPTFTGTMTAATISTVNMNLNGVSLGTSLPGLSTSVQGTGIPGLDQGKWFIWNNQTTFDPRETLRVDRHMTPSTVSGTSGNTYSGLWVNGTAGVNDNGWEWLGKFTANNYSLGTLNTQNVALNSTMFVMNNGTGQTGSSWGGNFVVNDMTGVNNPTYNRLGVEIDNYALDTAGGDSNRNRVILQLAYGSDNGLTPPAGNLLHFGRGILVSSNSANTMLDRVLEVAATGSYGYGFDTTKGTFTQPVYMMAENQKIAFDGVSSGAFNRTLRYQTGILAYNVAGTDVVQFSDAGDFTGGSVKASGPVIATGSPPTFSGTCAVTSVNGGNWAGTFKATGACSNLTLNIAFNRAAPSGYQCDVTNLTNIGNTARQGSYNTTSAGFLITAAANDNFIFKCVGF